MLSALSRTTLLLLVFTITRNISFAQPTNDACVNATLLTSATTCANTGGTVLAATNSGISANSCNGTPDDDVWFRFIAQGVNTTINITNIANGNPSLSKADAVVEVFHSSSGDCSTLSFVTCASTPNATSLTVSPLALTIGQTYYIRVFSTSSGAPANNATFNICVTHLPPPANDDCSGAINLSNGVSNTNGTVWSATASAGIPIGCAIGNPDDDVWYKYTATGTNLDVSLSAVGSNLNTSGTRLQLFSGTCGSLTSVACGTTNIATTVTNGATYYIRVYSAGTGSIGGAAAGSAFSITATATAPPANDECSGAITLSSGVANTAGSVWLATTSTGISSGCATGDPDDDVWYKFTPAGNSVTISLSAVGTELNSSGTRMQLFSGSCGSLTSVACGTTSITTAVNLGNTYYIRVYSAGTGSIGGTSSGSAFTITASSVAPSTVNSGRMKEVYHQTILSPANALADPWEITYGQDGYLWITEAKGYKVYRMDPVTGVKTTVLDISLNSTFFSSPTDQAFNVQFSSTQNPWPQGGMAGLALHPNFMHPTTPENFVYISYVRSYNGGTSPTGIFFTNRLARFTYNPGTGKLESPVSLCDTLPGSNDHNSQRIIIAPVGGTNYLFYASGDMGGGQFSNKDRPNRSQNSNSYEGKILRFNLKPDVTETGLDAWIPNDNPYSSTSAVWAIGIRNNQGFAYDTATGILYGSSHGPYSDDELNIIEPSRNYGHPLVIGYAADNNYNNSTAGASNTTSTCPLIVSETNNATAIGASYKDALFSAYARPQSEINNIWVTNPGNGNWPSEGWSGMDIYKHTLVPGWKNSLVVSSLKWGRVLRLKMNNAGTAIVPTNGYDTISYFGSTNRYRDIAFSPNGKDMFVIMDRSSTTSGPSAGSPIVPACAGCVQKYTFLGYADAGGKSSIPTAIDVTPGVLNNCVTGTTITIDNTNNNLWVPITGPDGNIMAEIKANSNNLGTVTSSFYTSSGTLRQRTGKRYLDRNITITPATQPSSPVSIRLYLTKAEFDALDAEPSSGITSIADLKILKNADACGAAIAASTQLINPVFAEAHGTNGYVLQANINSFSSFYFSSNAITLPMELVYFKGSLQNNSTLLQWETNNENNSSHFVVERSIDGRNFETIGTVTAGGTTTTAIQYSHIDNDAAHLSSLIIYYRLKMVDIDDKFKYSAVVTIYLPDITNRIVISPNPAKDETKVMITSTLSGEVQWKLTDNNGRIVMQNTFYIRKGSNNLAINIGNLPGGLYYLNIAGAGIDQNVKLQKL
ncbi:MAG TPA: PQQ-dependent sugar dehydrogenase [Chitinophagaceae bacterium]|nr:PQQ-dependent sugar dehydrogenase [Chitinophagaceae bacterium]